MQEIDLAAVMLTGRTDGEMQPDDTVRAVFEEELIEVLISVVGDVDQNAGFRQYSVL